ncbi:hypothetical protein [Nocardioides pelophilus]|uniref:hypothetical protein n=1 Tax=Nocardioides pelophilus TaxID=2172019 RepID=UPI0016029322|nr:hypothetical protein [Nocardioides pelophilus]
MTDRADSNVILTDDEVAAVASTTGRPWRRPLLTIEDSERALTSAIARGFRSLGLRGLVSEAGFTEPLLAAVAAQAGHKPVLAAVAVEDDLSWSTDAERWELFAARDGDSAALSCISTAAGIHVFAPCGFREAAEAFGELLKPAPPVDGREAAISVLVRGINGEHLDSYLMRAGVLSVMRPGSEGRLPPEPTEPVDWPGVLAAISTADRASAAEGQ